MSSDQNLLVLRVCQVFEKTLINDDKNMIIHCYRLAQATTGDYTQN